MKKGTKSSLGKILIAFLIVGVLALGVNHFYSIWVVGEKEFYETGEIIQYGLGYLMNPADSEWQEGSYGYFLMDSNHAASVANTVVELGSFNQDSWLWGDHTFESSIQMNDGSVPSGQLSTLQNYAPLHDRKPFESMLNIDYSINMPPSAGDYYLVVWRCDSAHYGCINPFGVYKDCLHKITRCEVYPRHIKVRSPDWCDTSVSGRGSDYCFSQWKSGVQGYCDMSNPQGGRCIDPCAGCSGANVMCLASKDYASTPQQLSQVMFKANSLGVSVCYPTAKTCSETFGCRHLYQAYLVHRTDELDYIQGFRCEKDNPDDELINFMNTVILPDGHEIGVCSAGAREKIDCSQGFGESANYDIQIPSGDFISGSGWGVKNGRCYLGECDDSSRCHVMYATQAFQCVHSSDIPNLRVCERKPCYSGNHMDCANLESTIEAGFVYACINGYCKKSDENQYPELIGLSRAYCDVRMSKVLNEPYMWVIRNGKCVEETIQDECSPSASQAELKQQCIASNKQCSEGYLYTCMSFGAQGYGTCGCEYTPPPMINCRTQDVIDDNEWCMRSCNPKNLPYCKKYACSGTQVGTGCLNCVLVDASCNTDSDCWVVNYQYGVCTKGCCDYSGVTPPSTTSSTIPNGGILPPGINIYIILGILMFVAGTVLFNRLRR